MIGRAVRKSRAVFFDRRLKSIQGTQENEFLGGHVMSTSRRGRPAIRCDGKLAAARDPGDEIDTRLLGMAGAMILIWVGFQIVGVGSPARACS